MARRVQELCALVAFEYGGDASRLWSDATDAKELERRIRALPGFGDMKLLSLSAVLWKRLGVEAARPLAPDFPTLGDVDSVEALHEYQAAKRAHQGGAPSAGEFLLAAHSAREPLDRLLPQRPDQIRGAVRPITVFRSPPCVARARRFACAYRARRGASGAPSVRAERRSQNSTLTSSIQLIACSCGGKPGKDRAVRCAGICRAGAR
jgi:hypothetical protein